MLALLLVVAAGVAVIFREALARIALTRFVGPAMGVEVHVGDISISLGGEIVVRGLLARSPEDWSRIRETRLRLLEATVSPLGIIWNGIGGIHSVKLHVAEIELDLDRSGTPGETPLEKEEDEGAWPERLPDLEIHVERAAIRSGGRETLIEALQVAKDGEQCTLAARRIASGPATLSIAVEGRLGPGSPPLRRPRLELAIRKLAIELEEERWTLDGAPVLRMDLDQERIVLDPPLVLVNGEGRVIAGIVEETAGGAVESLLRLEVHLPGSHPVPGSPGLAVAGLDATALTRLSGSLLGPGVAPRSVAVVAAVREIESRAGPIAGTGSGLRLHVALDRSREGGAAARASLEIPRIEVHTVHGKRLEQPLSGSLGVAASAGGSRVRLDALRGNLGPFLLQATGGAILEHTLDAILAGAPGSVAEVDGRARFAIADLARVRELAPEVRRAEGRVVLDVSATGTPGSPRVEADLLLDGIHVRHESFPALSNLTGRIVVREGSLTIDKLEGEVGGAVLRVTGGASGLPFAPRLGIRLDGDDVLLVRTDRARLRADLHLEARGEITSLLISGSVRARSGRVLHEVPLLAFLRTVTRKVGGLAPGRGPASRPAALRASGVELFRFAEPPLRDMQFDVEVTAAEPIELRGNVIRGGIRPNVKLLGKGEFPHLAGAIYVDDLVLALPATKLRVESGSIRFDERNPLVPDLNLTGETRMRGYDITAAVSGPANDPSIVFSSTPPLPADDLVLLVTTGRPPAAQGGAGSDERAVLTVARYFGEDLIRKLFSEDDVEAKESILDRFEIDSGRNVSRSGRDTWEARFRLKRQVLVDKDALFLTGDQDEFDHYNIGLRIIFQGS